jgi:hypothetical protein
VLEQLESEVVQQPHQELSHGEPIVRQRGG